MILIELAIVKAIEDKTDEYGKTLLEESPVQFEQLTAPSSLPEPYSYFPTPTGLRCRKPA